MLKKALFLIFILAGIAGCLGCGNTASHFVFATIPAANQIVVYREDPNSGVLTQVSGSPFPAGDGAHSVVVHPSGKFLYVANPAQNENDISLFTVASNGALTEVFPRTTVTPFATLPQNLVMDPAGAFLYVADAGSNNISSFSIDAGSGALTPVGTPLSIGFVPLNMQLTPSGNFLYVSAASQPLGFVAGFSVNAGTLTLVGVTSTDGINPNGLAIDPSGSFLYTANFQSNSISIFSIGSSGALQEVQGSPLIENFLAPISLTLDPAAQFLYVANQGSNDVAAYSISSSTGLPTALTTSTTTNAFGTEGNPSFLAVDPGGKYLLVGNQGTSAGIQVFVISSGNLTSIATYPTGNTISSMAILK